MDPTLRQEREGWGTRSFVATLTVKIQHWIAVLQILSSRLVYGRKNNVRLRPSFSTHVPWWEREASGTATVLVFSLLRDGRHFGVLQGACDSEGMRGRSASQVYFAIEGDGARKWDRLLTVSQQTVRDRDGAFRNHSIGTPLIEVD